MTPSAASTELAELLRELLAEVRGLRADLATQRPLADRALEAIDGVLGGEAFDAGRLLALARERVPGRAPLRAVVVEVVRDLDAPGAGRRLGRWLAQHVDYATASCEFRLGNSHETRNGAGYRVVRVAEVAPETRAGHRWP